MLQRLLIANRGEIAVRIVRTCRQLGIKTVAIYSDADKDALHTRLADEACRVGEGPPADSYLNIDRIMEIAERSDVDAIHPGYGFRSEHWEFAKACEDAGIAFVGPSSKTLSITGNKIDCKRMVKRLGVPVIPGTDEMVKDIEEGLRTARDIGYPVMLKTAYGGGGRGIREARNAEELRDGFNRAEKEAKGAFGKTGTYLEKILRPARHIEFQILSDGKGETIHLGERECSVQWRHQKLIEFTPSPVVDDETRKRVGAFAVAVAKAVGYRNAGTVEFLRGEDGGFYFIEMNSRLQVEHPVTELARGIDLVEEQLRIASGEGIGATTRESLARGAAIQCRINAEDPCTGFMPSVGRVSQIVIPGGPGVRVDTALDYGSDVSEYYDSLLAKVIVWGKNLEEARRRIVSALVEFKIGGLKTNVGFQRHVLAHEKFTKWELATDFLSRNLVIDSFAEASKSETTIALEEGAALAAAILARRPQRTVLLQGGTEGGSHPVQAHGGARFYDAV